MYIGYVDKNDIAKYVDQLKVWCWLLEFQIDEGEYFCNPWRIDNNPGCKLVRGYKWLSLKDYASMNSSNSFHNWNILQGTMYKHKLSFNDACELIWKTFVLDIDEPIVPQTRQINVESPMDYKCVIHFIPHLNKEGEPKYLLRDKMFWQPLTVTSDQLREDFTYSVQMYRFNDREDRMFQVYPNTWCYAYTFPSGHVKIYSPGKNVGKWISNATEYDIGGIDKLPNTGDILFICKSYKDWRIQKNLGYNAIWIQGERFLIPTNIISNLAMRFNRIIIYFDNDATGIEAGNYLAKYCNGVSNTDKFNAVWLPEKLYTEKEIKDNADFILSFGKDNLSKLIKHKFIDDHTNFY